MKNILIPTDFSKNANNAFLHALKIANQLGSQLYVLHCYQQPIVSFSHAGEPNLVEDVYQQIQMSKFEFFKNHTPLLHKLAEDNGLDHSKVVFLFEAGTVLEAVKKPVKREQIKLIVMGTLGAAGLQRQIVGTNTVSVIKNTPIPVLVVPEKASFTTIKKIAFTTLFRERDKMAMREITQLASYVGADIYVLHVFEDSSSTANILQYSEEWGKTFTDSNPNFIFLEKQGTVEDTINSFIEENQIDLLAVVKRNRTFFDRLMTSSLSNNLAFHATTPVLVFHEEGI